jgi:long-chain acyl-CoA synthetase
VNRYVQAPHLVQMILDRRAATPELPLFSDRIQGRWVSRTARELANEAELLGAGLLALELTPHARIAILCPGQWEWVVSAAAALFSRSVALAVPVELSAEKQIELIAKSKAEIVFACSGTHIEALASAKGQLPHVRRLVTFSSTALYAPEAKRDWVLPIEKLRSQGRRLLTRSPKKLERVAAEISQHDPAIELITAGTSHAPRAVTLTHRDWCEKLRLLSKEFSPHLGSGSERLYSSLPITSVWGQLEVWGALCMGWNKFFAASREHLSAELKEVRPTLLFGAPDFYEQLRELLETELESDPWWRRELRLWTSRARNHADTANRWWHASRWKMEGKLATQLAFRHLRKTVGGNLKLSFCGGASVSATQLSFFDQIGLPILECYGVTESAGPISLSLPNQTRAGSVGKPLPHYAIKTSEDGEILYQDRTVANASWRPTGDLGYLDSEGYLHVLERKADVLTLASGLTVSPRKIEKTLNSHRIVRQSVVLGHKRPYLAALIRLNTEALVEFATEHELVFSSIESLLRHPTVESLVQQTLEGVNQELDEPERLIRFALLKRDLSAQAGELNPLNLPRRSVIHKNFKEECDQLYPPSQGLTDAPAAR